MRCKTCISENERSKIFALSSTQTLMGHNSYYDEDGKPHSHNPNLLSQNFRCSNGHS